MTESPATAIASQQEEIDKVVKVTKRGFDPRARLEKRGLRKATITLFLDEEVGVKLGWAYDVHDVMGQFQRREREGVVGELDRLRQELDTVNDLYQKKIDQARVLGDDPLVASLEAEAAAERAELTQQIDELEAQREELFAELTKKAIVIKMRAVHPVIQKDCRRRAKEILGITTKNVPANLDDEFVLAYTACLMTAMFTEVIDNETGAVNTETTYDDAIAYMEMLPAGQYARLDNKMGEVQLTDAISRTIEAQEDFS